MSLRIFEVLDIGKQAVFTNQAAIGITGHNIANVNTPGFSRQSPVFETYSPQIVGGISFGRGSHVATIKKSYDRFLNAHINSEASILGQWKAKESLMVRAEAIFNESPELGLNKILSEFWKAWQDLTGSPDSESERPVLLTKGKTLARTFQNMVTAVDNLRFDANDRIAATVNQINQLATQIADLNQKILESQTSRGNTNDFSDTRSHLMGELAELIDFDTIEESDGQVTILVGKGKMLVSENQAWRLEVFSDPERDNLYGVQYVDSSSTKTDITNDIRGGNLKGNLDARDLAFTEYLDKLNVLAATLVNEVNRLHLIGHGLEGSTGNYFFSPNILKASAGDENTGGARIFDPVITDPTQLKASDFEMQFISETTYTLYDVRNQERLYHIDDTNNAIIFNDDGGINDAKAILTEGTYTGDELAAEIEKQLEAKSTPGQSYTVSYNKQNHKFTITNDSGNTNGLVIRWSEADTIAEQVLGFRNHDNANIAVGTATTSEIPAGTYIYADYTFAVAAGANQIVFNDDGVAGPPTYTATLTPGSYNSYELAAEIERQLEAASAAGGQNQSYTVVFDKANQRFAITSDSSNPNDLDLLWSASSANGVLGFDPTDTNNILPGNSDNGDNQVGTYTTFNSVQLYGISVRVANDTGTPQSGDVFLVSGVRDAARRITLATDIADSPDKIAAAQTIFHLNETNNTVVFDDDGGAPGTYTATLSAGDYTAEELAAEIEQQLEAESGAGQSYTVSYDYLSHRFNIRNDFENTNNLELLWNAAGTTAAQILGFDDTAPDIIVPDDTASSAFATYEFEVGDNGNALAIAGLQHAYVMGDVSVTFDSFYNGLVSEVGIDMQDANRSLDNQEFMMEQLIQKRDSISGVSLDEELTNLIKFQQAFAASAKIINTVNEMLDVLVEL